MVSAISIGGRAKNSVEPVGFAAQASAVSRAGADKRPEKPYF